MFSFWLAETKASLTRILLVSPELTALTARLESRPSCSGRKRGEVLEKSVAVAGRGTTRLLSHSPQRTAIFCLSHFCLPSLSKFIKELGRRWRGKRRDATVQTAISVIFSYAVVSYQKYFIVSYLLVKIWHYLWCVSEVSWTATTHLCR